MNNSEIILELKNKRTELEKQIQAIDQTIQLFNSENEAPEIAEKIVSSDGYDSTWSWKNKIIHVLKVHNRFLHIKEIAESISKYEDLDKPIDEIITSFRQSLSALKADNFIVRVSVSNQLRFSFWGSPNWLDKNGHIMAGYEYDPSFVQEEHMLTI